MYFNLNGIIKFLYLVVGSVLIALTYVLYAVLTCIVFVGKVIYVTARYFRNIVLRIAETMCECMRFLFANTLD